MRGRNTTVIAARVPDSAYFIIKARADGAGLTVQDYIKKQLGILPDGTMACPEVLKNYELHPSD